VERCMHGRIRKLVNNVTRTCETCYLRHQDQQSRQCSPRLSYRLPSGLKRFALTATCSMSRLHAPSTQTQLPTRSGMVGSLTTLSCVPLAVSPMPTLARTSASRFSPTLCHASSWVILRLQGLEAMGSARAEGYHLARRYLERGGVPSQSSRSHSTHVCLAGPG
jgi:hypothetical protein